MMTNRLRIAHVILGRCNPNSANGVDKSVYYLARAQSTLGATVGVFSITNKEPISINCVESVAVSSPNWMEVSKLASKAPRAWKELKQRLLDWKPDIVHFHSVHIGPFIGLGKILTQMGIPYCVTPHGGFAPGRLERVGWLTKAYIRIVEKLYLEKATLIHAVSGNDVEGLKLLGIKPKKVIFAPNGIDLGEIPSDVPKGLLKQRYPILEGRRVFLFLGRLDPNHKGLDLLLEGYALANPSQSVLVLVGPDWRGSMKHLPHLAERLGLSVGRHVIFTGPVYGKEKWAFLADTDVFVHTSRWEGFPFSVLEALAMGIPCLLTPSADPFNIITSHGAGTTVEVDALAISDGIRRLAQMETPKLQAMGERARALVEKEFKWKRIAQILVEAYAKYGQGQIS